MSASIFVFSRDVIGDTGEELRQTVTVYAQNLQSAHQTLKADFRRMQDLATKPETPYESGPSWAVTQIELNEPKIVTSALTQ